MNAIFLAIMEWSSEKFYNNELVADISVESHLLKDLKNVKVDENTGLNFVLYCFYFSLVS